MGILLIHSPYFAASALVLFLAGWFGLDGLRYLVGAFRRSDPVRSPTAWLLAGMGNLLVAGLVLTFHGQTLVWTVTIAVPLRLLETATNIILAPVLTAEDSGETVVGSLGLADHPELDALAKRLAEEEAARSGIDRGWVLGFIATLFAIHLGRMGLDRTFLGIVSPGVAVLGDLLIALLLAFAVLIPISVTFRTLPPPFHPPPSSSSPL